VNWKLTMNAVGEPELVSRDDEDLTIGFSMMKELARESDNGLVELAPGIYFQRFHQGDDDNGGWISGGC
jgi:hypothetical protein